MRSALKTKILICNIVITVLCVIAIASYFFLPFWKVDLSLRISADMVESMVSPEEDEENEPENGESENSKDVNLSNINFKEIVGENGVELNLTIELKTKQVLAAISKDATSSVQAILDENVNKIVEQLNEPLQNIAKATMKQAAKVTIKDMLRSQVEDIYGDEKTAEEVDQFLIDAGLDDTFVDAKTQELFDALHEENATVDSVSDKTVTIIEEAIDKMQATDSNKDFTLSDEDRASMKDSVKEVFETVAAEDGSIDMNTVIAELFLKMLNQEDSENTEENAQGSTFATTLSASTDTSENAEQDALEQLKTTLREKLSSSIDSETAETIASVLKIVGYVIIFTFFTWAYLILKILLKLGAKNNAIKLKLPILLGSIPFWILYLIPTVVIALLQAPPVFLVSVLGGESAAAELASAMAAFQISFFSCAWVSFVIGTFFLLFVLFYYGGIRRQLKRMIREGIDDEPTANDTSFDYTSKSNYDDVDP